MVKLMLVFVYIVGFLTTCYGAPEAQNTGFSEAPAALPTAPATSNTARTSQPSTSTSVSVECFACADCPEVSGNTTTKLCSPTYDASKRGACVSYVELYTHMKRPWHVRGCASERGSCKEIRESHSLNADVVKLQSCEQCEGDMCNSGPRTFSNLTIAFLMMTVTPLTAKFIVQ